MGEQIRTLLRNRLMHPADLIPARPVSEGLLVVLAAMQDRELREEYLAAARQEQPRVLLVLRVDRAERLVLLAELECSATRLEARRL